jgi:hypothetical protein
MTASVPLFPSAFAVFEPFADWAGATETLRNHYRIDRSQAEIDAFAATVVPRLAEICAYLDRFPLDDMPPDARRLYYLMLSTAEVAPSVEGYHTPSVPYGYDSRKFRAQEDFPLRPRY